MSGLYVHIPFCRQRCSYCDFYFVTGSRDIDRFVDAVVREISTVPDRYRQEDVNTLYFGGGTPSRLSGDQLARIVSAIESRFSLTEDAERTIEINPEDAGRGYLSTLRELHFNRLSIGVQSLRSDDLAFMRRAHTATQAKDAIDTARALGFNDLSVDLIFGLPEQSVDDWMAGVEFLIAGRIPHISTYGLTVEPRTILAKWISDGQPFNPDDDVMADMYLATIERLSSAGYEHYEISSFSIPGSESRHNSAYWHHANYLGFGPSAHSFWWDADAVRWGTVRSLRKYIAADFSHSEAIDSLEKLSSSQLASERVMLGLRTSSGVSRKELSSRYDHEFTVLGEAQILELEQSGRLVDNVGKISLTPTGRLISNAVTGQLCDDLVLRASNGGGDDGNDDDNDDVDDSPSGP